MISCRNNSFFVVLTYCDYLLSLKSHNKVHRRGYNHSMNNLVFRECSMKLYLCTWHSTRRKSEIAEEPYKGPRQIYNRCVWQPQEHSSSSATRQQFNTLLVYDAGVSSNNVRSSTGALLLASDMCLLRLFSYVIRRSSAVCFYGLWHRVGCVLCTAVVVCCSLFLLL